MNWCEEHDHFKRTCPWCEIEILQERLNRIAAIVNVLEQHGDIDHTTLTQLRGALNWEPGTSLKAAGWKVIGETQARPKGWDTPSRRRKMAERYPTEQKTIREII